MRSALNAKARALLVHHVWAANAVVTGPSLQSPAPVSTLTLGKVLAHSTVIRRARGGRSPTPDAILTAMSEIPVPGHVQAHGRALQLPSLNE